MPRKPRNPGSGKAPHNGPARGEAGSGDGWGGEAAGSGNGDDMGPAFEHGNKLMLNRFKPENMEREEWRARQSARLEDLLMMKAEGVKEDGSRTKWGPSESAARALHEIINGRPMQRVESDLKGSVAFVIEK